MKPRNAGGGGGDAPVKTCPTCESILAAAVQVCPDCGYEFPGLAVKIDPRATTLEILSSVRPQWVPVQDVDYHHHRKPGGQPSLRVEYRCGLVRHREWVCFEHTGYARQKACEWWYRHAPLTDVPETVEEALERAGELAVPSEIAVRPSGRFTEIINYRFAPCPDAMGSAPSATASVAAWAGSTPGIPSPTPAATPAAAGSAAAPARTSAIGDAA